MVTRHVVTLANSIVGVSVLAMPFCFKQCGIVLATLSLMMGAVMTRMVCYFLVKSAVMSRRRTYEMLAWSTFGHTGKFMVEISIIGFLIGTLIAFMVVIGDLGPEILSEIFSVENNSSLRTIIMTALSLFVALPLGLLRNIDSLSSVSTASVLFYLFLVIKIFSEGIGPLWSGEYLERIHFWKSGGVLQCIPIFSMALSCQTQLFGIYDSLAEPSLQKMNEIVKKAVNICTFFYFCVGFFGYIAFSHQNFGGNILLSFSNTWTTQLIKSMFLMSVVFSVPLVVFPCRASLHSLIFRSASAYHHVHDMSTNYIPESRMKFLTVTIVATTLVVGILIPNIELVLGLVGSTTGSVICIIFPSIMFVRVTSKSTTERLLAQLTFFFGVVLMLLTTYATLYAAEQSQVSSEKIPEPLRVTENMMLLKPILHQDEDIQLNSPVSNINTNSNEKHSQIHHVEFEHKIPEKMISNKNNERKAILPNGEPNNLKKVEVKNKEPVLEVSRHPSKPPNEDTGQKASLPEHPVKFDTFKESSKEKEPEKKEIKSYNKDEDIKDISQPDHAKQNQEKHQAKPNKPDIDIKSDRNKISSPVEKVNEVVSENVGKGEDEKKEFVEKHVAEEFLKRLEEHQENQKKLLEEQKEILEELKQHHAQDVREKMEKDKELKEPSKSGKKVENFDNLKDNGKNEVPYHAQPSPRVVDTDKMIQEQEKIIEKISENIEKESKNAQLLDKLEEGLNKEVKILDSQAKSLNVNVVGQKENQENTHNFKLSVEGNRNGEQVGLNENVKILKDRKPKESINNDILKNIDKEKGVLVGSLAGNKRNDPPLETNFKEDQVKKDKVNLVDETMHNDDKAKQNLQTDNNMVNLNAEISKKDAGGADVSDANVQRNNNQNQNLELIGKEVHKEAPSSSTKKSISESSSKGKVDREM